jgi:hypothetical protein
MAEELWGPCDGKTVLEHDFGKGHVIWGEPLADIFAAEHLKPDFEFQGASTRHTAGLYSPGGRVDGHLFRLQSTAAV